ncbi:uncharacterized protein [Clytia hemisphaerica]|uniref:glutathione gamma-glutamylcysteinyltransferase n=1 Tax=Clytia hemisphaerica TaxID=252671 RepID=A0A7M5V2Z3_9CNID
MSVQVLLRSRPKAAQLTLKGLRRGRSYSLETSSQHLQAAALQSPFQTVESEERPKKKNNQTTEVQKKEKKVSFLHNQKVNWLETILDNSEYERSITQEIANKTQFVPNIPSKHRVKLDHSVCIGADTPEGRDLLASTLYKGEYGKIFFTLWQQYLTQADSLNCGPSSLAFVLNALCMDPKRQWKYPWRFYDEGILNKCVPCSHTAVNGCSMDTLMCLAKSNGLSVEAVRASLDWTMDDFREDVKRSCSSLDNPIILNFSRGELNQTGTGHFSPLGAYNEEHDMVLVLETARFKYPPFWTKLPIMWRALQAEAVAPNNVKSGMRRGYMMLKQTGQGVATTTKIRLPWQQARVQIKTLSDDPKIMFSLYLLKHFKSFWENFLESSANKDMSCNLSIKKHDVISASLKEILRFSISAEKSGYKTTEKASTCAKTGSEPRPHPFDKFNFPQTKMTKTFQVVSELLKEELPSKVGSLESLERTLMTVLNLIEFEVEGKDIIMENPRINSDLNIEKMASLLSTLIIFWPYSTNFKHDDTNTNELISETNSALLRDATHSDRKLFTHARRTSVSEQISFILKAIDHVGHEFTYQKDTEVD